MKVRIKFSKEGPMKFLGHLDTMRYFQKALRRAALPVAFSGGYSPHMIMSFAAPLGVGIESRGEYFDVELTRTLRTDEIASRLDPEMVEGVRIIGARRVEDGKAGKAMALVAAADYEIAFRPGKEPESGWQEKLAPFLAQPDILVTKETKKGERQVDIRPFIYRMELLPWDKIFLRLASASANYTKPEAVMERFFAFLSETPQEFAWMTTRLEVYANAGTQEEPKFVTLESLGEAVYEIMEDSGNEEASAAEVSGDGEPLAEKVSVKKEIPAAEASGREGYPAAEASGREEYPAAPVSGEEEALS